MSKEDPFAGTTPCSCGFQQREHLRDCVSWGIIERRERAKQTSKIDEILEKVLQVHNHLCLICKPCVCTVCDCQTKIDLENDIFSYFHGDQLACGKCVDNHGECLTGTCRHIRCG